MSKSSTTAFLLLMCLALGSCSGPSQQRLLSGSGPFVLMISGKTGPTFYTEFAERLSDAGYRVALYDGNDFPLDHRQACRNKIRQIVESHTSQNFPKAAVVGYSLGGAVALICAGSLPDHISGIVAYYPATRLLPNAEAVVKDLSVPILVLQGEEDRYFNCCRVETIRKIQQEAQNQGHSLELVVYPQAGHGFNLGPLRNKQLDSDSWQKTLAALKRFFAAAFDCNMDINKKRVR